MRQVVTVDHVLEIAGPRGQIWRPAIDESMQAARQLAWRGELVAALEAAQDAYIERNGPMHGVCFRVRTVTETLSGFAGVVEIVDGPAQAQAQG